jgi:(1->4)-alpha-D-glucan 1-alpha-D-glucosylmutase
MGNSDSASSDRLKPPASTYRVQLHPGFGFDQAAGIVPYLRRLGIGALYASPHLQSAPGSTHGYDVVDPTQLNAELGDATSYQRLHQALSDHAMGFIVDIVPNHMGVANGANRYWQDVLENGRTSVYADFFDIDWGPIKPELSGKVLLPVLGDQYGVVLERGELQVEASGGRFRVCYYDLPLPIAPTSYPLILNRVIERVAGQFEADDLQLLELQSLISTFERLPPNERCDEESVSERRREQAVAMHRLALLLQESARLQQAVDDIVTELNGDPANPASFDGLDELLGRQSYRLAFWRVASDEINYRRFFAID